MSTAAGTTRDASVRPAVAEPYPAGPHALDRPAPAALADLLAEAPARPSRAGVDDARRRVAEAAGRARPPLQIDRRVLLAALQAPTGVDAAAGEPFRPAAGRCRRAIGLDAVDACLRGRHASAAEAVAAVLADVEGRRLAGQAVPWWAGWWATLGAGGRSAVRAEAVGWATRLWTGVAWSRLPAPAVVVSRDGRWRPPAAPWLTVRGRVDIRVDLGGGVGSHLVVGEGQAPAQWAVLLSLPVLVGLLGGGRGVPGTRVVGWWPDTGQVRVADVDDAVLGACAGAVADVVAAHTGRP